MAVMTVNGPVDKESLGITLPHEHLFVDLSFIYKEPSDPSRKADSQRDVTPADLHTLKNDMSAIRSNLVLDSPESAARELERFKRAGGGTIIEQSSFGVGRREMDIQDVSRKTGVHIVVGGGFYIRESLPPSIVGASERELADRMIEEARKGIGETGIRPGIIGEIGISAQIGEWDRKVLRAAALAQRETGRAVSVHIQAVPTLREFSGELNGVEALRLLEQAGADLGRVIVCHTDAKIDQAYLRAIISMGSYAELDHFGKDLYFASSDFLMDRDMDRVLAVRDLVGSGCAERILISQDVCLRTDLVAYGGFGYAHILENIVPMLLRKGVSEGAIRTIMRDNPQRLLDVDERYL